MTNRTASAAMALLLSVAAASLAVAEPNAVVLTGSLSAADHETYRRLPFEVPEGIGLISIRFDYDRAERTTVDLGLEDPERFRGWSGGNKSAFRLSEAAATPSYLPGPLPAGRWHLVLGVPNIRPGVTADFRAEITFARGAKAFTLPFAEKPLRDEPGWYRGDLHAHSGHSDGSCESRTGRRVPCPAHRTLEAAAERGLHFVALTEHNARSHLQSLHELQDAFDDLVLLSAREITTFHGHFNVFGTTAPIDFRAEAARDMDAVLATAAGMGGLVSINHPALPSGEACMGCGWRADTGWQHVTAVEVVNGSALEVAGGDADGPLSGIPFWEALLDRGLRVTAVGGSDNHDPGMEASTPGAVGRPTTVIAATELSQPALLEGIRLGRVFVDVEGTRDRTIDLTARSPSGSAVMGGVLAVREGETVEMTVTVSNLPDANVRLIRSGGAPIPPDGLPAQSQGRLRWSYSLVGDGGVGWVRAEGVDGTGRLVLLSNPIYLDQAR
jgi:hypothetical protein